MNFSNLSKPYLDRYPNLFSDIEAERLRLAANGKKWHKACYIPIGAVANLLKFDQKSKIAQIMIAAAQNVAAIKKALSELAEDEPPPKRKQRTQPICHAESISQQYYRFAVLKMGGEFSAQDFKNSGLPKTHKAAAFLAGLVETGKLIRTCKGRFAVVKKEASK